MLFGRNWSTWLLLSLLAAMMLAAVSCDSEVSRNADDYVGEYVFMPANAAANDFPTFIILKKDGSTVGMRFYKETGTVLTTQDPWYLQYATEQDVVIGKFSYPIHRSRSATRLVINEVGQYYEKVR
jgi:hypothetical protein